MAPRAAGGQDWPEPTAAGGLVLTIPSTAPRLATDGPRSLLICCRARMTAWQRAGHEVKVLPRSPIVAPPLRHPCAPLACQCRLNFPHLCRSKIPQVRRSAISRPADRLSVIVADVRGDAARLVRLRA